MPLFLVFIVIGLTGLVTMAIPGLARHGHTGAGTHGLGHAAGGHAAGGHLTGHATPHAGALQTKTAPTTSGTRTWASVIPPLPTIFAFLAVYGAFGNLLLKGAHLPMLWASLAALVPAWAVERFLVSPLWNLMMRAQGEPCSPLEDLLLREAEAVTVFKNGRGIVSVVRDGRMVQFSAHLLEAQANMPIRVGDKLRIEEVDAEKEHLTVTLN